MMQSTCFSLLPRLLITLFSMILIVGFSYGRSIRMSYTFSGIQHDMDFLVQNMTPDEVDLSNLKKTELEGENPYVVRFLENADRLARSVIGYRKDKRSAP